MTARCAAAREAPRNESQPEEIFMTRNVGSVDRAIRIVAGLALLSLVFVGPKSLWGLVGLVPLGTALMGWCPAYTLLGLRTCKVAN
jgi:hypothetical protein